jgi:hypothetical protein
MSAGSVWAHSHWNIADCCWIMNITGLAALVFGTYLSISGFGNVHERS